MGYIVRDAKTGYYAVRIIIPAELRAFFPGKHGKPKTALQRSLGTPDKAEANRRAPPWIDKFMRMIAEARRRAASKLPVVPLSAAFEIVETWKREQAQRDDAELYRDMTDPDPARRIMFRNMHLLNMRSQLAKYDSTNLPPLPPPPRRTKVGPGTYLVEETLELAHPIDELLTGWGIGRDHPSYGVCFDLMRAEWLPMVEERLRQMRPSALSVPTPTQAALTKPAPMASIFDAWKGECKPAAKTAYSWKAIIKKLTDFVGHDDAAQITKAGITRWKDALVKAGTLAHKTIENHLIVVRCIFRYGYENGHIPTNPAEFVRFKAKDDPTKDKRGYDDDEARLVLTRARTQTDAHKRWVPWLAAFTGARCDELCGAMASDVRVVDGVNVIRIDPTNREEGASVKNRSSIRTVPLHRAIIEEGLLKYKNGLRKDGPLFPEVTPDRFGKRGGNGSKTLGRWVREKLGIIDERIQPNHAWRHRFADECRKHGIPREIRFVLDGHALNAEGDGYGAQGTEGYTMSLLAQWIAKLPSPLT